MSIVQGLEASWRGLWVAHCPRVPFGFWFIVFTGGGRDEQKRRGYKAVYRHGDCWGKGREVELTVDKDYGGIFAHIVGTDNDIDCSMLFMLDEDGGMFIDGGRDAIGEATVAGFWFEVMSQNSVGAKNKENTVLKDEVVHLRHIVKFLKEERCITK